jgi:glyoxylase-like metal-dependent hydrolase (beta-lactamase superfamily II)
MIFQQFLSPSTGRLSYLLGCASAGVCAVIDPESEIESYLQAAARESLRVTHVFETHVEPERSSGARRLRTVTRAPVFVHESTTLDFPHVGVGDGEEHDLGRVRVSILETPGHTPDSLSILVTDRSRAAEPWFVLTGGALLAGAVGGRCR